MSNGKFYAILIFIVLMTVLSMAFSIRFFDLDCDYVPIGEIIYRDFPESD